MKENYELMKEEYKEVKRLLLRAVGEDLLENMSEEDFHAYKSMLAFMDTFMKCEEDRMECLMRLEEKLDKLLTK